MAAARQTLSIEKRKLHMKRETYENESAARQEKAPEGKPGPSRKQIETLLQSRGSKITNYSTTWNRERKTNNNGIDENR